MKIIVNADDFGISKATNIGILEAFNNGIVTDTTILTNKNYFDHAVNLYKNNSILNVGIHLNLTSGKPLINNHKTIINNKGYFYRPNALYLVYEKFDEYEIEKEFNAQIEKVIKNGIKISHIDTHHHIHSYYIIGKIVLKLAQELKVPIRRFPTIYPIRENVVNTKNIQKLYENDISTTDFFDTSFYDECATEENFIKIIEKYDKNSTLEIMTHPAFIDQELIESTIYSLKRAKELQVLCSKTLKDYLSKNNVELISYRDFCYKQM